MRRTLLMVMAIAMFMSFGTAAALAGGEASGSKPGGCKYGKNSKGKCKPKPPECPYGKEKGGKCKPKPPECPYGKDKDGNCSPKPPECRYGKDDDGNCKPPPIVVPTPETGPCSKADLVLLEDLLKGTGALLCVYLGDNSPNASTQYDCPDALLALPVDNLIGACLFLPPAEVERSATTTSEASSSPAAALGEAAEDAGLKEESHGAGLQGLLSTLTGLLKLV